MTALLLAVPLLPLLASLVVWLLPRKVAQRYPRLPPVLVIGATGAALCALLLLHGARIAVRADWFESGGRVLQAGLELGGLSWAIAVLVAAVALAVLVYGAGYMRGEPLRARFFAELGLFVGAMLALVLASSFVLLFAAWELVGLASWLLIGFHHRKPGSASAATKAFLMTRIGDVGFLLGWLLVLGVTGTTDIARFLELAAAGSLPPAFATLLALLFFSAAVGKSAQLPLSLWLPDAMVAPTPVSALLHSATMVAAGVYLMLRLYPLLAATADARAVIFWLGLLSATIGALLATAQTDLKRLLAWSTISQLGEMLLAVGLGAPYAAALHLVAHGLFKSTLFMCAGSIDKYAGTRDLRELGGIWRVLPVTAACFAVGALALAGIEPLFTETSHDAILGAAWRTGPAQGLAVLALLLLAGMYIGRAAALLLGGPTRAGENNTDAVGHTMRLGMLGTAAGAVLITPLLKGMGPLLPFPPVASSSLAVHLGALGAGACGLLLGAASAWRRGAAPVLGTAVLKLQRPLVGLVSAACALVWSMAAAAEALERWLDGVVRHLVAAAYAISGSGRSGLAGIESALDASAGSLARTARSLADGTEQAERTTFAAAADALAHLLQAGGGRMRAVQTGKLYLYTLGLFAWTMVVLVAAALLYLK